MQFISMYTFLYVYMHSKFVYLLTQKIRFIGSYGLVRWIRVVYTVSGSQCQDSGRLLRVAAPLCFVLQRQLSIERLQMGKRHIAFLCDGRRAGRGEEGDESYHSASLSCGVSSTPWGIICFNLKTTAIKTNTQVWSRYINVPLEREVLYLLLAFAACYLAGFFFLITLSGGIAQWLGVFYVLVSVLNTRGIKVSQTWPLMTRCSQSRRET